MLDSILSNLYCSLDVYNTQDIVSNRFFNEDFMSEYTDGTDSATEKGKAGDSGKAKDQRRKVVEFGLNTIRTLVTVGLLWYLRASSLVCSVEGGGCTLSCFFGEGLRLLIPVLIVRLLVDLPLGLLRLPVFGLAERPLADGTSPAYGADCKGPAARQGRRSRTVPARRPERRRRSAQAGQPYPRLL